MNELWQCKICRSIVPRNQIDGLCEVCRNNVCANCRRICDRCQKIFCMFHVESKIVMRQQKPFIHKLCKTCSEVW